MSSTQTQPTTADQFSRVRSDLANTRYSLRATRRRAAAYSHIPVPPGLDTLATALERLAGAVEGLAEVVERREEAQP